MSSEELADKKKKEIVISSAPNFTELEQLMIEVWCVQAVPTAAMSEFGEVDTGMTSRKRKRSPDKGERAFEVLEEAAEATTDIEPKGKRGRGRGRPLRARRRGRGSRGRGRGSVKRN